VPSGNLSRNPFPTNPFCELKIQESGATSWKLFLGFCPREVFFRTMRIHGSMGFLGRYLVSVFFLAPMD
jgi:hypothetical protein